MPFAKVWIITVNVLVVFFVVYLFIIERGDSRYWLWYLLCLIGWNIFASLLYLLLFSTPRRTLKKDVVFFSITALPILVERLS